MIGITAKIPIRGSITLRKTDSLQFFREKFPYRQAPYHPVYRFLQDKTFFGGCRRKNYSFIDLN